MNPHCIHKTHVPVKTGGSGDMMTKEAHLSCRGRLSQLSVMGVKQLCQDLAFKTSSPNKMRQIRQAETVYLIQTANRHDLGHSLK